METKRVKIDHELKECEALIQECAFLSARLLFPEHLPIFNEDSSDDEQNEETNRRAQFMLLCINRWFSKGEKFTEEMIDLLIYLTGGAVVVGQGRPLSVVAMEVIKEKTDDPLFRDLLKRNCKPSPNH